MTFLNCLIMELNLYEIAGYKQISGNNVLEIL